MLDVLSEAMAALAGSGVHAEARHVVSRTRWVRVHDGRVAAAGDDATEGVGVRARAAGGWAYAASAQSTRAGVEDAARRAVALARALPARRRDPGLLPVPPARGHWAGPCERDPFAVSIDEVSELLLAADAGMHDEARVTATDGMFLAVGTSSAFASTEGAACTQEHMRTAAGIAATALGDGELQIRSYPCALPGGSGAGGWELVTGLDLAAHAGRVAAEASELCLAPPCPDGLATLVLGSDQIALQVHESIGHALELDRMQGDEAGYAGTSWVTPDRVGTLRYGSEQLNVTADATVPGGLGTFGWDDEGVAARRIALIRDGMLRGVLSGRDSAAEAGLAEPGGCVRAEGWARQPILRMTNVSIEPGEAGTLADLLADTGEGIFLDTNRSWSIDDRRLAFRFSTEVAREIRGGELGRLYRNPAYSGRTPEFWASLDAVCGPSEWRLRGTLNCGKGEPGQMMHVSHGSAPARFRGVRVGSA
jgi:TldD protein